ncbi:MULTISPECIES: hypothetical protein [unclassified Gilliamella]|uniref:hypothetical protein n=1 Tax=unclassified Gilliamella TaxID=2685620 RepID=UPI00130B1C01|nr:MULTISPECIES: hypothetical protein [unclassified Gilliamella]MWP49041.1 hypothetical protein [Gilliamella sp. Lep-s35]MWP68868.1 hypothetical protein [Gilliamella sp. Lep-s5]MWP76908.1 hypothetical protein [Gilliamella sp. Lep-s21]
MGYLHKDHVKSLLKKICEDYLLQDICDKNKQQELAKDFIIGMDKLSQVIFKKISTFKWTITADGFSYSPGNIGCCGCDDQETKRKLLKEKLKGTQRLAASNAKKFWGVLYSSIEACNNLKDADFTCTAGAVTPNHHRNNNTGYYQERINIEKFQGFK